jgi:hypothetical protein
MLIAVVCRPCQMDVARWGYALDPQAFIEAGLSRELEARPRGESADLDRVASGGAYARLRHESGARRARLRRLPKGCPSAPICFLVSEESDFTYTVGALAGASTQGPPASTAVQVARLAREEFLLEVEAVAAVPL